MKSALATMAVACAWTVPALAQAPASRTPGPGRPPPGQGRPRPFLTPPPSVATPAASPGPSDSPGLPRPGRSCRPRWRPMRSRRRRSCCRPSRSSSYHQNCNVCHDASGIPDALRSEYGLRSLSKCHEAQPYVFGEHVVRYSPGESLERIKGGNSNWRGPIWFPTAFLMIESLRKLRKAYGRQFAIPSSTAGEGMVTPDDIARGFADRLIRIFTHDGCGRRPVHGNHRVWQEASPLADYVLFVPVFPRR